MFYELLILKTLKHLMNQQEKIMAQIDDLNTAIDAVSGDVASVASDVTEVLQLLKNAQGTSADLSPAIAKLAAVKTALDTVDANLKAVEPAAPPAAS